MPNVSVSREQSDHGTKVMAALTELVASIQRATADGWQAGQDLPPILSTAFKTTVDVVNEAPGLGPDAKDDVVAFGRALTTGGWDMAELFIKKSAT